MLMPITRCLLFALLFGVGLTYGLIAFLPLSIVANEIQKNIPGISIGETSGHWWQGRFNNASWQQFNHGTLSWTLHLAAFLQGNIVAN